MRATVDRFEVTLQAVDSAIRWLLVIALLSMTAVLFFNSVGRSLLNISFVGGPALGRLLTIWLTFLGGYLAVRTGSHITIDVLRRLLPERVVSVMPIPVGICGAVTTAYVTWLGLSFTLTRFSAGQIDPMLEIPSGFFYLPVPVGGFLMTLAFLQVALTSIVHRGERTCD